LRTLAKDLCEQYAIEDSIWEVRLAELAWKAAVETKPEIFVRKSPFILED
jgi:hypothetical protein